MVPSSCSRLTKIALIQQDQQRQDLQRDKGKGDQVTDAVRREDLFCCVLCTPSVWLMVRGSQQSAYWCDVSRTVLRTDSYAVVQN